MRVHNFSPGPCTLPVDVLEEARDEFLDFAGTGMSIIEMSHRSAAYDAVHRRTIDLARSVAEAPPEFEVMLLQGGATLQFAMVPMNLLGTGEKAGYVVSGAWGRKALASASKAGGAYAAWDGADEDYRRMPAAAELRVEQGTRYLHVTSNETIGGIRMVRYPDRGLPLVADMSSDYLARRIDWGRFDLVYGGVQKNLGPAGLALVFVRRSLLDAGKDLPDYLSYAWHAESGSLGNTPAMFQVYLMGKVLERIAARGGTTALEAEAAARATLVYDAIDGSDGFYRNPVDPAARSHTNVVFRLPSAELESEFLSQAQRRGLVGLKGHRSVGGCRVSLYAAMELESVRELVDHMTEFRRAA